MFADKYAGQHWDGGPSMEVVRARHQAVLKRRCVCGRKKDPVEKSNGLGRRWLSCQRCLGVIKQLS